MDEAQIAILLVCIAGAVVLLDGTLWVYWNIRKSRVSTEMKGDLAKGEAGLAEEKAAIGNGELPKQKAHIGVAGEMTDETGDCDLPDAYIIFSEREIFGKWLCEECGTKNDIKAACCIVCGVERR